MTATELKGIKITIDFVMISYLTNPAYNILLFFIKRDL